ncbi:MAG: SulP family inorganic anion transporter [Spirochaetaceae bacterium]|nr:SulP family inorganic anion transporter [Spirochaetaceae bacterium]
MPSGAGADGGEPDWRALPALLEPSVLWRWSPGAAFGIALYLAMKRWRNPLILPLSVALAVGGYHLALASLGISGDEARAAGLLLTSTADGGLWPSVLPADLAHLDWQALAGQVPHMLTLILVAFICVVLNIAGLELAADQELDWDREFRVTGAASAIAGLGGGTVATLVVPASLRSKLFGAATRLTGVVAALVVGGALFLGDGMLELVPAALVGGILVFAGLGMLDEGLVKSRRRLPWAEYGIIVLIFVAITAFGLLEGVAAGMLATLVFFVVRLSGVNPVEARFTLRERHSNKARPVPDRAILLEEGERVHAYRLRGYLFFGGVSPLAERLRQELRGPVRPLCLLLDFSAVSGFDFSAVNVLCRFMQTAHAAGVPVVLSAASEGLRTGVEHNLSASVYADLPMEPNLDRALERCEEIVLAAWKEDEERTHGRRAALLEHAAGDLDRYLERQIDFETLTEQLQPWTKPRRYDAGAALKGPGAPRHGLQLLTSGRASGYDAEAARVNQYRHGDVVWPPESLHEKADSVVADEPCRTMHLTPDARIRLEQRNPQLALKLYRYLFGARVSRE